MKRSWTDLSNFSTSKPSMESWHNLWRNFAHLMLQVRCYKSWNESATVSVITFSLIWIMRQNNMVLHKLQQTIYLLKALSLSLSLFLSLSLCARARTRACVELLPYVRDWSSKNPNYISEFRFWIWSLSSNSMLRPDSVTAHLRLFGQATVILHTITYGCCY